MIRSVLGLHEPLARSWALVGPRTFGLADPKTERSERDVYLPPQTVVELRKWKLQQDAERDAAGRDWTHWAASDEPVIGDPYGRRFTSHDVSRQFRLAREHLDLPKATPHSLRHSYATLLLGAGTPITVVSEQMGHSLVSTTLNVYASHVEKSQAIQVGVTMGRLLESGST